MPKNLLVRTHTGLAVIIVIVVLALCYYVLLELLPLYLIFKSDHLHKHLLRGNYRKVLSQGSRLARIIEWLNDSFLYRMCLRHNRSLYILSRLKPDVALTAMATAHFALGDIQGFYRDLDRIQESPDVQRFWRLLYYRLNDMEEEIARIEPDFHYDKSIGKEWEFMEGIRLFKAGYPTKARPILDEACRRLKYPLYREIVDRLYGKKG